MSATEDRDLCIKYIKERYPPGQLNLLSNALTLEPKPVEQALRHMLPFDPNYPPRLVGILGLTDLSYLEWLITQDIIKKEVKRFIILVNNAQDVANLLNSPNFKYFLTSPQFKFILCPGKENCKPLLFNILKNPEFSKIMDQAQLFPNSAAEPEDAEVHEYFGNAYNETVFHVYHNYGRINDSLEGVRSTLLNGSRILTTHGIQDLKNKARGLSACIVGAGPSLDADIETLAKNKDKFIIFAADAAVKPLLKAGIEPHFTTSIERGNLYQRPFWEGLPKINTTLVYFPVVHPEVLSLYPGPTRIAYRNYSYYAYFEKSWPKGLLQSGGSTSHLANRLAFYMGCEKVILIGIDSTYEKHPTEDTYRSHCNNLGHGYWAEYHPLEYFQKEKRHAPSFEALANDGTNVMTNVTYHQWTKEFAEEVISLNAKGRMFTAAAKGVQTPGIEYVPLEQFCDTLPKIAQLPQLLPEGPVKVNRDFTHKELRQNVRGWLAALDKFLTYTSNVDKLTPNDIALSHSFIYHKFLQDHCFVGFVIQNCAAEFYKLENEWSSMPADLSIALPDRLDLLRRHALLYQKVLGKLEKIIENPNEEIA